MSIIVGIALLALAAVAVLAAWERLLMPVRSTAGAEVYALVVVSGDADGLEAAVKGLRWLSDSGKARLRLIIADSSASPEAKMRARLVCQNNGGLLTELDTLGEAVKDNVWREPDTQP